MAPKRKSFSNSKKKTPPARKKFRKPTTGVYKSNNGKQMLTLVGAVAVLGLLIWGVNAYRSGFFDAKKAPKVVVKQEKKVDIDDINKIKIAEATWGMNCDGKPVLSRFGTRQSHGEFYKVQRNNVLGKVKELCQHKKVCKVKATTKFLGFESAENCPKYLTVNYRCFSYDRLREKNISQGGYLEVNCQKQK